MLKRVLLIVIISLLVVILVRLTIKEKIYIQLVDIPDMEYRFISYENDPGRIEEVIIGYPDQRFASWILEIDTIKIKRKEYDFFCKNIINSQHWLIFNYRYQDPYCKQRKLRNNKIYIIKKAGMEYQILPIKSIRFAHITNASEF